MSTQPNVSVEIRIISGCHVVTITKKGWLGPWNEVSVHPSLIEAIAHIALVRTQNNVFVLRGDEKYGLLDIVRVEKKGP